MEDYHFKELYVAIFLVWSIGYLKDKDLIAFLSKASSNLQKDRQVKTRTQQPGAFIFVLDNVATPLLPPKKVKGQQIRKQSDIEAIFREAGLHIFDRQKKVELHEDYYPVMMWALY